MTWVMLDPTTFEIYWEPIKRPPTHTERLLMNADANGLVAIPTLDTTFTVSSDGRIISILDCCIVCDAHAPQHCINCHL